jgi:hypothetical protein
VATARPCLVLRDVSQEETDRTYMCQILRFGASALDTGLCVIRSDDWEPEINATPYITVIAHTPCQVVLASRINRASEM